jgi:EmrB/QacA subfamily drug resistance transporter
VTSAAAPHWSRASAIIVAATMFMEQMDSTVLFTAVPSISRDFGLASTSITVATTAYLVASATFIPLGGWLASRFGGRRVYLAAIVVFTLASVGCALSPNLVVLTVFRLVQGFGGSMMVPVGRLIVLRNTRPADLIRAIAYITWPALLAPVVAPLIGGALTASVGWRWIFIINVPIGIIAFLLAARMLAETEERRVAFDRLGLILCTVAVFALIFGTELLSTSGQLVAAVASLVTFVVIIVPAIRHLRTTDDPLFDLRAFRRPSYRVTNSGGLAYRAAVTSVPFLIPLLLQNALGFDPVRSGVFVAAIFLGNVGIKPLTTPILRAFRFRTVLVVSAAAAVAFLAAFALVGRDTPPVWLFVALLLSGVFRSIGFTAYNTIQFADVPTNELPSANTLSATLQELSVALGIAVASTALRVAEIAQPTASLVPFEVAFGVMGAIALVAVVSAIRLPAGIGDAVRQRQAVGD